MLIPADYKNKHIAVFGLGRTGQTAVAALKAAGADVYAWDDQPTNHASAADVLHDLYALDFDVLDALLLAPGVPLTHPEPHALVKKAKKFGVPIMGDFDLFHGVEPYLPAHKTVAITGTNGKSTTTALIAHMIKSAGLPVVMGGNIGRGVMSLEPLTAGGVYIFEMSSYQIDLTHKFAPDVAVLLNITPDHLDRHGGMAGYIQAKARLFELLKLDGTAIISADDAYCQGVYESLRENKRHQSTTIRAITADQPLSADGSCAADGSLDYQVDGMRHTAGSITGYPALKGSHNWQNMAAAFEVGMALGLSKEAILKSFETFPGLEHRQEIVAMIGGVTFVNDSKATNNEAAAKALSSFENIHWIAGGRGKGDDYHALMPALGHVKQAYFIGEAGPAMMAGLGDTVSSSLHTTMVDAFTAAVQAVSAGDTVLLSPACSAFDQFADFEQRGTVFKESVALYKTSLQKGQPS